MPKKTLGEYLTDKKIISSAQLQTARLEAEKTGEALGHVLVRLGLTSEPKILEYYTDHCGILRANLKNIDLNLISLVSDLPVKKYHLVPIAKKDNYLVVAMSDPTNVIVIDEIKFRTGFDVEPQVAPASEISNILNQTAREHGSVGDIIKSIDLQSVAVGEEEGEYSKLRSLAEEAPIIKLVNTFIIQAYHDRASDLHIEPDENILRIRHRIDGALYDVATLPKNLQPAIISRAKIMADLNIALKRIPQDGRFKIDIDGNPIDVRVSTLPTISGENVVMRLLDSRSILIGMDKLGFEDEDLIKFKKVLDSAYGIILVTGPTGSGKTTTLYSALSSLNSPRKNIMTIEDPVEYHIFGIRQTQINTKAGLTFASGLRSILRQDPDIIMVGEIRDLETAEIAVQAALTGHLVLSTLHTNDATSALTRLTDMGVEPFLISSAVVGVIGQRLVRTICPDCKESYVPNQKMLKENGLNIAEKEAIFYRGKGCPTCKGIGYKGRVGISEIMLMNEKIKEQVLSKSSATLINKTAEEAGMKCLRDNGLRKVLRGITSIEDVLQVSRGD